MLTLEIGKLMSNLNLDLLKEKIRYGTEPDNSALIEFWLEQDLPTMKINGSRQAHYESQFRLLLNAVMDELVPKHWRLQCLDHIYRPLMSFKRVANCTHSEQRLNELFRELTISCNYTEQSLY